MIKHGRGRKRGGARGGRRKTQEAPEGGGRIGGGGGERRKFGGISRRRRKRKEEEGESSVVVVRRLLLWLHPPTEAEEKLGINLRWVPPGKTRCGGEAKRSWKVLNSPYPKQIMHKEDCFRKSGVACTLYQPFTMVVFSFRGIMVEFRTFWLSGEEGREGRGGKAEAGECLLSCGF